MGENKRTLSPKEMKDAPAKWEAMILSKTELKVAIEQTHGFQNVARLSEEIHRDELERLYVHGQSSESTQRRLTATCDSQDSACVFLISAILLFLVYWIVYRRVAAPVKRSRKQSTSLGRYPGVEPEIDMV